MDITFQHTLLDFRALSKMKEVTKPAWLKRGRYKIVKPGDRVSVLKYTGTIDKPLKVTNKFKASDNKKKSVAERKRRGRDKMVKSEERIGQLKYKRINDKPQNAFNKPKATDDKQKSVAEKSKIRDHYTAHKAIRFFSSAKIEYGYEIDGKLTIPQVESRTFKPKNQLVNTYKLNFFDSFVLPINKSNISQLEKIIDHYRKIQVIIPRKNESGSTILQDIGYSLSHQFYAATTAESHAKSLSNFLLKSDKGKFKVYENLVARNMMLCRPVAIFEFYGAPDLGELNDIYKVCDFVEDGVAIYHCIIHDRMSIWLIVKPQKKPDKDLIKNIKSYILDTDREIQTIQKLVKYLQKTPRSKYRKVIFDKIPHFIPVINHPHKNECNTIPYRVLRANIDQLVDDSHFNKMQKFVPQQEQIRAHILKMYEVEANEIIGTFTDFESLRLRWNTLFVLVKKDFWEVAASELMQSYPEEEVVLREFIEALKRGDFKRCIKLINPYRDLIGKLLAKAIQLVKA